MAALLKACVCVVPVALPPADCSAALIHSTLLLLGHALHLVSSSANSRVVRWGCCLRCQLASRLRLHAERWTSLKSFQATPRLPVSCVGQDASWHGGFDWRQCGCMVAELLLPCVTGVVCCSAVSCLQGRAACHASHL